MGISLKPRQRLHDWPERLDACIESWRYIKFELRTKNCISFCLSVEESLYGKSIYQKYVNKYSSGIQAKKILLSGEGLVELMEEHLEEVSIKLAKRGDICIIELEGMLASTVILGTSLAGMGLKGLVFMPKVSTNILKAWSL